ncbi:MAG: hypothetical protein ACK514_02160, partial [Bacteroidota bacterium]
EQNLEFKIRNIDLLNELAGKRVSGLALRAEAESIDDLFIDTLDALCKKNIGQAALRIYLKNQQALQTELLARTVRIKPTNELIKELKRLAEVGVVTDKQEVRWLSEQPINAPAKAEVGTISSNFVLELAEVEVDN